MAKFVTVTIQTICEDEHAEDIVKVFRMNSGFFVETAEIALMDGDYDKEGYVLSEIKVEIL